MTSILVDTNVLVYAHDRGEFAKQEQAIRVLEHLRRTGAGCLSVQCLGEFFSITTRGAVPKLTIAEAAQQVEWFVHSWPILELSPMIVLEALRGVRDHKLAYWDSQLWATARLNQIPTLLSEDLASARRWREYDSSIPSRLILSSKCGPDQVRLFQESDHLRRLAPDTCTHRQVRCRQIRR